MLRPVVGGSSDKRIEEVSIPARASVEGSELGIEDVEVSRL